MGNKVHKMSNFIEAGLFKELINFCATHSATIIALASVVVAIVSAIFAAYQAFISRQHNRLSVRPHITTWADQTDEDKLYKIKFELINNGLGPAILKEINIFFEKKLIGNNKNRDDLEKSILEILSKQPNISRRVVSMMGLDFPLPAGERQTLLEIHIPFSWDLKKDEYMAFLDKFDAEISYQSMYREGFFYHTYKDKNIEPRKEN